MNARYTWRWLSVIVLIGLSLPLSSTAQSLSGRFQTELIDGGSTLEVTVQIKSEKTPTFNLGPSTFQFTYNLSALSFPIEPVKNVDYIFTSFHQDTNSDYLGSSLTHPSGRIVSLNIFIFSPGNGQAVRFSEYMDVATVRFSVTDGSQLANLEWALCEYASDDFSLEESGCSLFQNQDTPLPVELTRFEAEQERDGVRLTWETASELDNAGFQVQMYGPFSEDWEDAKFVTGAGTTNAPQTYTAHIPNLMPADYRFRLKQIDFDGTFAIGPTVELRVGLPGAYQLASAYPNPFDTQTQFTLAVAQTQHIQLAVYDAQGRQVRTLYDDVMEKGRAYPFVVDAEDLPAGMYLYRAVGEVFSADRTLVVVR